VLNLCYVSLVSFRNSATYPNSGLFSGYAVMSSNDAVSMVFKCMLKGAADFLVKPIRKNELRNLWQHVWRKQLVRLRYQFNSSAVFLKKIDHN
jgi:FixJ family two-component response regulator